MAAPNIVNVTNIIGKTVGALMTTSSSDVVVNSTNSNKVLKVNAILIANVDGTNPVDITIGFYDASANVTYRIASTITLPADATLDVLGKSLYLEEGDKITALASVNSRAEVIVSYEDIS